MRDLIVVALLGVVYTANVAIAQTPNCNTALVVNTSSANSSLSEQLAILQSVPRETFEEAKKGLDTNRTAIIGNIPITSAMNWSNFSGKIDEILSNYKFDLDLPSSYQFLNAYLSNTRSPAYQGCLNDLRPIGTHLWVDSRGGPNSKTVAVHVVFNAASDGKPLRLFMNYFGGKPQITQAQWDHFNKFQGSLDDIILFSRDSVDTDAGFYVNIPAATKNQSDYVRLPPRFVIKRVRYEIINWDSHAHFTSSGQHENTGDYCFPNSEGDQLKMKDGAKILTARPYAIATDNRSTQSAWLKSRSEDFNVCATWAVEGDREGAGHGADVGFKLTLQLPRFSPIPLGQ